MPKIFISYRREDSPDATGRIHDHLVQTFPKGDVFIDVDSITLGVDFRKRLGDAVGRCDVALVVIGPKWLAAADEQGRRRLDSEEDFVRIEVESALERNIPVVPVLVSGARMPKAAELPPSIKELAFRNGTSVRTGRDFKSDVLNLIRELTAFKPEPAAAARDRSRLELKAESC
jgi:hypothetical protein